MRNIIRLFFKAEGFNPWIILVCLLTASTIEVIGFASLVPLLLVATNTGSNELSPLLDIARDALTSLGLSLDVGPLLGFFVGTLILRSLLRFVAMQHVGKAIAEFTARLRLRLIRNLFRARRRYLVYQPVGRLTHAISGQTGQAAQAYQLAATFLAQTLQTTGCLAVASVVSRPIRLPFWRS